MFPLSVNVFHDRLSIVHSFVVCLFMHNWLKIKFTALTTKIKIFCCLEVKWHVIYSFENRAFECNVNRVVNFEQKMKKHISLHVFTRLVNISM